MKKFLALLLALALILSLATAVFANGDGDTTTTTYTITITSALSDETYTAYKVFNATYTEAGAVAYTPANGDLTGDMLTYFKVENGYVTALDAAKDSDGNLTSGAIAAIKAYVASASAAGTATASVAEGSADATATINVSSAGYYYVTTTTGSIVSVDTAKPTASVQEKNTVPTVDKKQGTTEETYADTDLNVNIGDTIFFQITVTIGKGNDKVITVTDTASTGLTIDTDSIAVKSGDTTLTNGTDYTLTTTPDEGETYTFKIVLTETYVKGHSEGGVVVTYTGKLNANANATNAGNTNSVSLSYSSQTASDSVKQTTGQFTLKKTDGTNYLAGATFELYTDSDLTSKVYFTKSTDGATYTKCDSKDSGATTEIAVIEGGVTIKGLEDGSYYLDETVVPAGYNKASTTKVTIPTDTEVTVKNSAGSTLPTTGGIGTTIFYIVGSVLVVGAGVLLVTKKRMSAAE